MYIRHMLGECGRQGKDSTAAKLDSLGDQLGFSHRYANWCIMAIPQAVDKSSSGQTSTTNIITTDSGLPVASP